MQRKPGNLGEPSSRFRTISRGSATLTAPPTTTLRNVQNIHGLGDTALLTFPPFHSPRFQYESDAIGMHAKRSPLAFPALSQAPLLFPILIILPVPSQNSYNLLPISVGYGYLNPWLGVQCILSLVLTRWNRPPKKSIIPQGVTAGPLRKLWILQITGSYSYSLSIRH